MNRKSLFILLGILIFGFALRVYQISKVSMYGDELTMVYDTYSILKTGKDSTGKVLPITFTMGAGRQGGYIYASLPFVYLFGPTEIGIRLLSILSGLGIIVLIYFLAKKIFGNENIGLWASFLTSISMWDIYLSRGGFEAHFALCLVLLGCVMFLYKKYIPFSVSWGVATLTYPTFKLTLPLIFLILIWYTGIKDIIKNKIFVFSLVILSLFGLIALKETLFGISEQRFISQNIFSDSQISQQIIQNINSERNLSTLPNIVKPLFFNKEIEYFRVLVENYVNNISPKFLFLRGDGNPRHNPGEWGMLYLVELPLIFYSLVLLWNKDKKLFGILLSWILIVPLATMLMGDPHALRNDLMIPPLILLSAFAIYNLPNKYKLIVMFCIALQLILVMQRVYYLAPDKFASFWSRDAKETVLIAIKNSSNQKVVLSTKKVDNIEYAYQVYAKIDPNLIISQYGNFPKVFGNVLIIDK